MDLRTILMNSQSIDGSGVRETIALRNNTVHQKLGLIL